VRPRTAILLAVLMLTIVGVFVVQLILAT